MGNNLAVELRGIRKVFGSVVANADVNLLVEKGTVHAIVGENGAGKSTAMKVLYGQYRADGGEIRVDGKPRAWKSPRDAIAAGIGMVHQHFMLAGPHTVLENILLGRQRFPLRSLGKGRARKELLELMRAFGIAADLDARIEDLPVGIQQRVEILKLLYCRAQVLILDEPTAVLTPSETQALFRVLRGLVSQGSTVLLITHKLKEVLAVADRVTTFRGGRVVDDRPTAGTSTEELAELMVGRRLQRGTDARPPRREELVLLARKLSGPEGSRLREFSVELHAGEIIGIAGVEGNGQSELIQALIDPKRRGGGALEILGKDTSALDIRGIRDLGMALLPEDRLKEGLLLDHSLKENLLLGREKNPHFFHGLFLDRNALRRDSERRIAAYDVRARDLDLPARSLSGGNQQKLVAARELAENPRFLLAAQPSRGVDIGAIEFLHGKLLEIRSAGAGILLISSELDELLALSDRIFVLYRGTVAATFERKDFDEKKIGLHMAAGPGAGSAP